MGYEEFVLSALSRGKEYNQLPATLQAIITYEDYQQRVLEHWIGRGAEWAGSPAQSACGEAEYYEALIKSYKSWLRVYPYHLAGYVCRVMRVTPFKYYSDMICTALVAERPYHQLPNFTAADAVRILGIGRNEYIAMLNTCKGRRLLWRVNRMSVAKEVMPAAPQAVKTEPWWRVACVNLSDGEFRELGLDEMAALKSAGMPGAHLVVGDLNKDVLLGLWRKGLVYLEVPVQPTDRYTIPPLEGFVSNKDAAAPLGARVGTTGPGTDPLEALLYAVFVANSERLRVEELAGILNQGVPDVCTAMSLACRLGFATRVDPPASSVGTPRASLVVSGGLDGAAGSTGASTRGQNSTGVLFLKDDSGEGGELGANDAEAQALAAQLLGKGRPDGRAVALVLDAEATSFLMMGALSPGLKRHAVTLFEGGRVAGEALISEFASELWASHAQGQAFEGDMARLAQFAGALATALDVARAAAGPSCAVELLRKESLAGLQPAAAAKVLATAYCALLPVTPLPHPPLPLALNQPTAPAYFGPTVYSMSPWSALALYHTAGCGPVSIALCCGQRLWRLPDALKGATHALVWSWDVETDAARAKAAGLAGLASDGGPSLVDSPMLLFTLNELLARSAVLVQPINATPPAPPVDGFSKLLLSNNDRGSQLPGIADTDSTSDQSGAIAEGAVVDVPLPLSPEDIPELLSGPGAGGSTGAAAKTIVVVKGVLRRTAEQVQVPLTAGVLQALTQLGVAQSLGMLRVIQLPGQAGGMLHARDMGPTRRSGIDPGFNSRTLSGTWLPLSLHMGVPLYCLPLCKAVCAQAQAMGFLSTAGQVKQVEAQHVLQRNLDEIIARFATWREPPGVAAKTSRSSFGGSAARTVGVSYGVIDLPVVNLLFDGSVLVPLDVSDCIQGGGLLSIR